MPKQRNKPTRFTLRCSPELNDLLVSNKHNLADIIVREAQQQETITHLQAENGILQLQLACLAEENTRFLQQNSCLQSVNDALQSQIISTTAKITCIQAENNTQHLQITHLIDETANLKTQVTNLSNLTALQSNIKPVKKDSYVSDLKAPKLNERTHQSDKVLSAAFSNVVAIHGERALPWVLSKYFEQYKTDHFMEILVNHYKKGQIKHELEAKIVNRVNTTITTVEAVRMVDTTSGLNLTGFLAVMARLRDALPTGCLPTDHDIKEIRKQWGVEMAQKLDLQPTGDNTIGWDVDPHKLLMFLVTEIYPKLWEDVCRPMPRKAMVSHSRCVTFVDNSTALKLGDVLIFGEHKQAIVWVIWPTTEAEPPVYLVNDPIPVPLNAEVECVVQKSICILRSDDGRDILGKGQVMESWRIINEEMKESAQNVNDVWFSCLIDGAEDKTNMENGRKRQFEFFKDLTAKGYIEIYGKPYPIVVWGPADLKNLKVMFQRGGNPCTTEDFCTHCGRTRQHRSLLTLMSYRVGSGTRPKSISELSIKYVFYCACSFIS